MFKDPDIHTIKLHKFLRNADLPESRRYDYPYLLRNLGIRNSQKPGYEDAIKEIKKIVKSLYNI